MSKRGLFFISYVAAITALLTAAWLTFAAPASAAETPNWMDRAAFAYWEHQRAQADDVDALQVIDAQVADDASGSNNIALPSFGRTQFTHINKFCEAEQNPPEGWLRSNGYCGLTDQMAKGSLMYTGEDYNFGFKHP